MVRLHRWLFGIFGLGTCVVVACVSDAPATSDGSDAGGTDSSTDTLGNDAISNIDADTGPCNIDAPFGTPVLVQGLPIINSVVRLSQDELTAYFAMQVIDDGGPFSLYEATRSSMTAPFGAPVALDALNDDAGESDPAVSIDGHDIIYVRAYGPPNTAPLRDIWHGSRVSLDASFTSPTKIGGGVNVDASSQEDYPSLAANDDLWFISTRGDAGQAIYRAKTAGGINYASVDIAANINAPGTKQYYPVVSQDGQRIYYLRDQTLYTATRDSTDNFSNPSPVTELNNALPGLRPGWVSPDNCRLYVTVGSPQTAYVASKPPN